MSIVIQTIRHPGVIGANESRVWTQWEASTGPRNLMAAARMLSECRAAAARSYGNVGCGATFLVIDGQRIEDFDLTDIAETEEAAGEFYAPKSRTHYARKLLAEVESGAYAARVKAVQAEIAAMDREGDA